MSTTVSLQSNLNKTENDFQGQLESFFSSWSKLETKSTLPERLKSFFDEWSKLPPQEIVQNEQPIIFSPEKLDDLNKFLTTQLPPAMLALKKWRSLGSEINVWEVAGLKHDEVRNTGVLKWLLDCFGSHGQGNEILISLLKSLEVKYSTFPKFVDKVSDYSSRTEVSLSGEKESRVDIEIFGQHFMFFIEVKIKANESNNQLDQYLEGAKRNAGLRPWCVLYLTRDGKLPPRIYDFGPAKEIYSHLFPISWIHVRKILTQHIQKLPLDSYSFKTIQQFTSHLENF